MSHSNSDVVEQYVAFCAGPLRDATQSRAEYEILVNHPDVTFVGFHNPSVLMVGTPPIIIEHRHNEYLVGEFIIFLVRHRVGRVWEVDFRFFNVTNPLNSECGLPHYYQHPHVLADSHPLIEGVAGRMCIQRGQQAVYQHIRQGKMHLAAPRLVTILRIYGTGNPYQGVEFWPKLIGGKK